MEAFVIRQLYIHTWTEASVNNQRVPIDTKLGLWLEQEGRDTYSLQHFLPSKSIFRKAVCAKKSVW